MGSNTRNAYDLKAGENKLEEINIALDLMESSIASISGSTAIKYSELSKNYAITPHSQFVFDPATGLPTSDYSSYHWSVESRLYSEQSKVNARGQAQEARARALTADSYATALSVVSIFKYDETQDNGVDEDGGIYSVLTDPVEYSALWHSNNVGGDFVKDLDVTTIDGKKFARRMNQGNGEWFEVTSIAGDASQTIYDNSIVNETTATNLQDTTDELYTKQSLVREDVGASALTSTEVNNNVTGYNGGDNIYIINKKFSVIIKDGHANQFCVINNNDGAVIEYNGYASNYADCYVDGNIVHTYEFVLKQYHIIEIDEVTGVATILETYDISNITLSDITNMYVYTDGTKRIACNRFGSAIIFNYGTNTVELGLTTIDGSYLVSDYKNNKLYVYNNTYNHFKELSTVDLSEVSGTITSPLDVAISGIFTESIDDASVFSAFTNTKLFVFRFNTNQTITLIHEYNVGDSEYPEKVNNKTGSYCIADNTYGIRMWHYKSLTNNYPVVRFDSDPTARDYGYKGKDYTANAYAKGSLSLQHSTGGALAPFSQTIGIGTEVNASSSGGFACGQYNEAKPDTILEVGNGTGLSSKSNLFDVDQDGAKRATPSIAGAAKMRYDSVANKLYIRLDGSDA